MRVDGAGVKVGPEDEPCGAEGADADHFLAGIAEDREKGAGRGEGEKFMFPQ